MCDPRLSKTENKETGSWSLNVINWFAYLHTIQKSNFNLTLQIWGQDSDTVFLKRPGLNTVSDSVSWKWIIRWIRNESGGESFPRCFEMGFVANDSEPIQKKNLSIPYVPVNVSPCESPWRSSEALFTPRLCICESDQSRRCSVVSVLGSSNIQVNSEIKMTNT